MSNARGSVTNTTVSGNQIGVQAGDNSAPRLRESTFSGNKSVGLTFDGATTGSVTQSTIEENGNVGIQIAGTSPASVTGNTISKQGVGILATETSTPQIRDNTLADHDIGVQISGQAQVQVAGNRISRSATAGISVTETAGGTVSGNTIGDATDIARSGVRARRRRRSRTTRSTARARSASRSWRRRTARHLGTRSTGRDIAIQLGGSAPADIRQRHRRRAAVGILFGEASTGTAEDNRVTVAEGVGIMASGTSNPQINRNRLKDSAAGLVFSGERQPEEPRSTR